MNVTEGRRWNCGRVPLNFAIHVRRFVGQRWRGGKSIPKKYFLDDENIP